MQIFLALFVLILSKTLKAETNFLLDAGLRSKPYAMNLVGTLASDHLLWGQKQLASSNYGFVRLGTRFGGSPTMAAFLQVAPISPLVFEIQKGMTQRFLRTSNFDCDQFECLGRIDRTDYVLRLVGAYENNIFSASFLWRDLRTLDSEKNTYLELENFVVTPGFHTFFESTWLWAYKIVDKRILGIVYTQGLISEGQKRFDSAYGIYRFNWQEDSITLGLGTYRSDHEQLSGISAILRLSRRWGETLSLF